MCASLEFKGAQILIENPAVLKKVSAEYVHLSADIPLLCVSIYVPRGGLLLRCGQIWNVSVSVCLRV